jgi:2-C-methyl-D-erythritol 4-phosphate cytidylyltransferase
MYTAIILLAGLGKRVGANINKIRLKVNDKYIFMYSYEKFLKKNIPLVLVVNKNDYDFFKSLNLNCKLVIGGKTRSKSVKNALEVVDTDYVLIHDGARFNISSDLIDKCLNFNGEAFYVGVPLKDTIREKDTSKTLKRDNLISVQTPQGGLTKLFKKYISEGTDDISYLVGHAKIELILGSDSNFKITTKEDLDYANYLYRSKLC